MKFKLISIWLLITFCLPSLWADEEIIPNSEKEVIDLEYERAQLIRTDREFSQHSMVYGPAAAFEEYLLDDALMLPAGLPPVYGKENIYTVIISNGKNYSLIWEPRGCEVSKSADMGYTWGIFIASITTQDGEKHSAKGKYLNVWLKDENGNWKVKVDTGNSNPREEAASEEKTSDDPNAR